MIDPTPGGAAQAVDRHTASDGALLVSLHLPKTAGTSFATSLASAFGGGYRADYDDLPMQAPRWGRRLQAIRAGGALRGSLPPAVRCVHGHFLPLKYRLALGRRPARYITWLRDPVERVVSHYHFWRRDYDGADPAQPLRNRMLHEQWSLERFALGPELRNVYSEYLWGFPVTAFAFIGITERYAADLAWFASRHLGAGAVAATALANPDRDSAGYALDPGLRQRIERHHAADMAIYRRVLDNPPRC